MTTTPALPHRSPTHLKTGPGWTAAADSLKRPGFDAAPV